MSDALLKILIPNSDANGLRVIEFSGHTIKAIFVPRGNLGDLKDLPEAAALAVYFLFAEPKDGRSFVYIGQTDNALRRLTQHNTDKDADAWNCALIFTGDAGINVQYLESRCIQEAKEIGRFEISNGTNPPGKPVSSMGKTENENFFEKMKFLTSLLGFRVFERLPTGTKSDNLYIAKDVTKQDAYGRGELLVSGEFIIFEGSLARKEEKPGLSSSSRLLRKALFEEGVLIDSDSSYIFTRDYIFSSPSAAYNVIVGRTGNGWDGWKDENGKTLNENIKRG